MVHFYSPVEKEKLRRREKASLCAIWAFALTALILCITLCLSTNTANATYHRALTPILSTLFGWAVLLTLNLVYLPAKAEYRHFQRLEGENPAWHHGICSRGKERIHIPKSVDVIPLRLNSGDETLCLQALSRYEKKLPPDESPVRLLCAGKFVLAWEVDS